MKKYTQIKEQERVKIYDGVKQGMSQVEIGRLLGRNKSTVSRELKRNSDDIGYQYPRNSQRQTEARKARHGSKIARNKLMQSYVIEQLKNGWSPGVIAGRWSKEHPKQRICAETIYQFIYSTKQKPAELWKFLDKRKRKRGLVRKTRSKEKIQDRTSIHQRPPEVDARQQFGHVEGDLFFNQGNRSVNVLTTVEISLVKHNSKHSKSIIASLKKSIGSYASSCTFDNGLEFAAHHTLGIPTYFCDAHSPWQKGSVENAIKLLRRYIPFAMEPRTITQEFLDSVAHMLNNRPRKILNFSTPYEVFMRELNQINPTLSRVKPALPAVEASFNSNLISVALHS